MSLIGGSLLLLSLLYIAGSVDSSGVQPLSFVDSSGVQREFALETGTWFSTPNEAWSKKQFLNFVNECLKIKWDVKNPAESKWLKDALGEYHYDLGNFVCDWVAQTEGDGTYILTFDSAKDLFTRLMWTIEGEKDFRGNGIFPMTLLNPQEQDFAENGVSIMMASLFYRRTSVKLPIFWTPTEGESPELTNDYPQDQD
uniref:Uncharacterized protein n=1 Tax=Spongospora subterranea TaxID=70186 RepID=A0A0H5R3H4_9EUKA|eukprot:CRZ08755.1 hypothetical protein [Spongospora subterranea]